MAKRRKAGLKKPTQKHSRAKRPSPPRKSKSAKVSRGKAARSTAKAKSSRRVKKTQARATAQERAFDALASMRHGKSLAKAARSAHTSPATVKKYAETALRREPTRQYRAAKGDRLTRQLRFPTDTGLVAVPVSGAAAATRVGRYWNAVKRFIDEGVADGLAEFRGKTIRFGGKRLPFITNLDLLEQLAFAGELEFFELYHATA